MVKKLSEGLMSGEADVVCGADLLRVG